MKAFRIHAQIRIGTKTAPTPKTVAHPPRSAESRTEERTACEAICRKCEWWQDIGKLSRCVHPKCGCFRAIGRHHPWRFLPHCPDKKW